jgi:hypothetical protein
MVRDYFQKSYTDHLRGDPAHEYMVFMSNANKTSSLSVHTLSTLGAWSRGPAKMTASYHDETTVRLDVCGRSRVLTEREWLQMWDNIRDAGYTRAA